MSDIATRDLILREIREDKREVDFVCSTETIDSYDSVLRQNWRLDRYKTNPVVLFAHESRELPIGHATDVRVVKKQLVATIRFSSAEANPRAEHVWHSVREGALRGISVGFYPHRVSEEEVNGRQILVLDDNELLELSVTPIPSNPDALAQLRQRAADATRAVMPAHIKITAADGPPKAAERGVQENDTMSTENETAALKAKLEQRDADVASRDKAITEERAALAAAQRDLVAERTARTAAETRAKALEDETIVRAVKDLVGVKLTAAEVDDEVEAARANLDNFKKRMAKRPDLGLRDGKSAIGDASDPLKARDVGADDGERAFGDFMKAMS